MMPRLIPCSSSPAPGISSSRKKSTIVGRSSPTGRPRRSRPDDVVAGRLAQQHRLARAPRHAAEVAARRRGPDEGRGRRSRAAPCASCRRGCCRPRRGSRDRPRARRRVSPRPRDQVDAERLDEGALAHAGHAGDADPARPARCGQAALEHALRPASVVGGAAALDQRDGPGEDDAVAARIALDVLVHAQRVGAAGPPSHRRRRTRGAVERVEHRLRGVADHRARPEDADGARAGQRKS